MGFLGRRKSERDVNRVATILVGIVGHVVGLYVYGVLGGGNDVLGYGFGVVAAALLLVAVTGMSRRRA